MSSNEQTAALTVPPWTLGWRLKRALEFSGVKAGDMAAELGVNRTTVSRWMHDDGAPPKTAYLREWARITRVPLAWLREGDDIFTWNVRTPGDLLVAA